ncbi:hypothetical protein D3C87_1427110 [compost metagenome]
MRRNIIVEGRVGYINEDYDVIDRQNDRWSAGIRGTYLINRRLGVTASYEYEDRSSSGVDRINDFNTSRFMVSLVAQY